MRVSMIVPALAAVSLLSACVVVQGPGLGRLNGTRTLVPDPAPAPTPVEAVALTGTGGLHRLGVTPVLDQ